MDAERFYVKFLLETTRAQQLSLLTTATESQVKALSEIAYNLPKLTDLAHHQRFISYLGNQKHTLRYKRRLVKKHAVRLLRVLLSVKDQLLQLLG